jgi:dTDP-4-amino-4,6-dideoxygalactose transaminase
MATLSAPVGGFFARHLPTPPPTEARVLQVWTQGRPHTAFVNARSAFAALIRALAPPTVWLPAWLCRDMVQPAWADRVCFYPVDPGFRPDLTAVGTQARAGDLLLVLAAFGLPVDEATQAFIARRPDLHFVEDRAQALDAGIGSGAGWTLYSPRKLFGVADGGLLVADDNEVTLPRPEAVADAAALWRAPDLRAADPAGHDNALWHAANQTKEAAMAVTGEAMTADSLQLLATTPLSTLTEPRLRNWKALDERLRHWSALPSNLTAPPLGYVLNLEPATRDRLRARLNAARVFAAVHWPELASPADSYPREHSWTRRLLTLPCDHRYGAAEMAAIADLVVEALG